jgi:hypothetical protein
VLVNNVLSSMETLQINVVETPAGPTFFKDCNKTYVTEANQVKANRTKYDGVNHKIVSKRVPFLGLWRTKSAARLASSL